MWRELHLHWLRARLWWLRLAERQMGAAHPDIPLVLREQWQIHNRIKELEHDLTR